MPKRFRFFLASRLLCSLTVLVVALFAPRGATASTQHNAMRDTFSQGVHSQGVHSQGVHSQGVHSQGEYKSQRVSWWSARLAFAVGAKPASPRHTKRSSAARPLPDLASRARSAPNLGARRTANAAVASRGEKSERGRALWRAVLWAQAAALCLACVVAWLIERAQPGDQSANARASGGNWLRTREHFARTSAGGNESHVPATGWARETLSHSLRVERTRAVLPAAWPLLLGFTRWALLTVFVLPAAALWVSAAPAPRLGVQSAVFLVAATIAVATLLLARWRVRGRGAFALILCSGLGVATPLLALARDALTQNASPLTNAAQPVAIWQEGAPWLSRSLLREDEWNALASAGVHLSAFDAGYLVGATLVCATALVMGQQMARRALFDRPPVEIRHVHPLSLPLPQDVRARLHWVLFCLPIALALALRSWGDAPGIAAMLALAGALCLGGWRFKVLGAPQFASALAFALTASFALWMIWIVSGGTLVGAAGGKTQSRTTASRAHRDVAIPDVAIPAMRDATTLSGGLIPGGATGTGTIGKPTRHDSPALEAKAAIRRLSQMPALWLRRAIAHAPFWCGALVFLALVLWLLKRPPAHLWSILSLAPAWGWMLLGGMGALALSPLMLANGQIVAVALGMALLPAFFFVWLERA